MGGGEEVHENKTPVEIKTGIHENRLTGIYDISVFIPRGSTLYRTGWQVCRMNGIHGNS